MSFNSSRRHGLKDLGEAWFWCNDCPKDERRWQFGGIEGLAKHRKIAHGIDDWPVTETVDGDHMILNADGDRLMVDDRPVSAPLHKGWIRNRSKTTRLYGGAR